MGGYFYYVAQKKPWPPRAASINQDPCSHIFPNNQNSQWNTPMSWQTWSPQPPQNQPWQQGWRGNMLSYPQLSYPHPQFSHQ